MADDHAPTEPAVLDIPDVLDVKVRVRPGASRTKVGGAYGEFDPNRPTVAPPLVVAVNAPASDGKATEAVLRAVAAAFEVRRGAVTLLHGATSRDKLLRIHGATLHRLHELLGL